VRGFSLCLGWTSTNEGRPASGLCLGLGLFPRMAGLAAALLLASFAATVSASIIRGKTGIPCGCFGTAGTISWDTAARAAALGLGALAAAAPFPALAVSDGRWENPGVALAILLAAGATVLWLASAVHLVSLARDARPKRRIDRGVTR
jgi:Methylamine utilisation protein MauE